MARRNKDLPRGRQRSGWKAEFLEATGKAPVDLGDLSDEDILRAIRKQRKTTRSEPGITLAE